MTTLNQISQQQANRVTAINEVFEAVSPAGMFGVDRELTVALTFAYFGGLMLVDNVWTPIADGSLVLSASATNYIERTRAGVVSKNTSGFTPGSVPLYTAVTSSSGISTLTDYRQTNQGRTGKLAVNISGSPTYGTYTLTHQEAQCDILEFSGAITSNVNVIVPTAAKRYTVFNSTTGAFTFTVKTASGTGVVIATAKTADVYADGTNVRRITADNP